MAENIMPNIIPLEDFIRLPSTVDFHVVYSPAVQEYLRTHPEVRLGAVLAGGYAVLYTAAENFRNALDELRLSYMYSTPQIYTTMGREDLINAGILQVSELPSLDLRGRGVMIGFVDTGIDYTNACFRYEDGSSKIHCIWDQTLPGTPPIEAPFGEVFRRNEIDEALNAEDPRSIVPHSDNDGHGTFLASVAAGRSMGELVGAAPDSAIICVKLKKASEPLLISRQVPPKQDNAFSSADIMLGIDFILREAAQLGNAPVVICIGLGSNFGSHNGRTALEEYIEHITRRPGTIVCAAAGNESTARHHAAGRLMRTGDIQPVNIRVAPSVRAFNVLFTSTLRDRVTVSINSPTGEIIGRVPFGNNLEYRRNLLLEDSYIIISYSQSYANSIFVQVFTPAPGIWTINLHGDTILAGDYHAWLPVTGLVDPGVEFLQPDPSYTLVIPSTSSGAIVSGAYNSSNNAAYVNSSWGPTADGRILPDFVSPGVRVSGFYPNNRQGAMTGTSVSSAITAGACALLLQWGVVEGNLPIMTGEVAQGLLILGCTRNPERVYPNVQSGYGRLNLLQTFYRMRER